MKILTILPTLNEETNLKILYLQIIATKIKTDLYFIDDGSEDNTVKHINKFIKRKKNFKIYINKRNKRLGIGKAHKDGLMFAYKKKYDLAITMDTDLAHHPRYFYNLLKLIKKCDLVIGSRFLKKNSTPKWSLFRVWLRNCSHFFTKLLFKHNYDSTNSFRCYKLNNINKNFLKYTPDQYDFFFTSLAILKKRKYKIQEFPMVVYGRSHGSSNMRLYHIFKSVTMIFIFYLKLFFIK